MIQFEAMEDAGPRVAVVMTCHNRRELTLRCLRSVRAQAGGPWVLELYLTDDGSTDGTGEAVGEAWPGATIVPGNGSLFWNGGMRAAWMEAVATDPDYYWLVNDDTVMLAGALRSLQELVGEPESWAIGVGAVEEPETGRPVYGGWRCRGRERVVPSGDPERCETMNANCTLVPRRVCRELGIFFEGFTHGMGDFDYGLRASRAGVALWQTGRAVARCAGNPATGTWRDRSLSRAERWRRICSPKGLPPREWWAYTRRNEGWLWPVRFVSPYLRIALGR